jgi:hypothetical protein
MGCGASTPVGPSEAELAAAAELEAKQAEAERLKKEEEKREQERLAQVSLVRAFCAPPRMYSSAPEPTAACHARRVPRARTHARTHAGNDIWCSVAILAWVLVRMWV